MRHTALVGALVLLALPALAGCVGTAQASAMQQQPTAESIAQQWDPAAELVGVVGVEGQNIGSFFGGDGVHDSEGTQFFARAEDDDAIGDGNCEVWIYRFTSPNQSDAYIVVVDRDGEVLYEDEDDRDTSDRPIGSYSVDSDEAADIALDESEGLREGRSKDHYGIMLVLTRNSLSENPTWVVAGGGGDRSGGGGGFVSIDAVTGEVLASYGGSGSAGGFDWDG